MLNVNLIYKTAYGKIKPCGHSLSVTLLLRKTCLCSYREEHDRRVAQQMHEEASKEEQRQREMEVCIISFY